MQQDIAAKPIIRSYLKSFSRIMKKRTPAFFLNYRRNIQTGLHRIYIEYRLRFTIFNIFTVFSLFVLCHLFLGGRKKNRKTVV